MLTPEEINKIAREYAEYCCRETDYEGDIVERNMDLSICANEVALPMLEWLSKTHCIVPKSKASELCRLTLENGNSGDFGLIDGLVDWVCDNFGEEYLNEIDNPST